VASTAWILAFQRILQILNLLFNFPSPISGGEENIIRIFAPFLQIKLHAIKAYRFFGFVLLQPVGQVLVGFGSGVLNPNLVFAQVFATQQPQAVQTIEAFQCGLDQAIEPIKSRAWSFLGTIFGGEFSGASIRDLPDCATFV
jgi:hypothetical protein